MGIEKLKGSLLFEAQEESGRIVNEAESSARILIETERAKEREMQAQAHSDVDRMLSDQRNERIAWARLEAKRILAEAKEDSIKAVLEDFFGSLESMRKTPEYKRFIKDSVEKAAAELGGNVIVHIRKGEKDLVPKARGISIVEDLEGLGGAIVESSDGKILVNQSLETLFESKRDDIRSRINEKIFGGR